MSHFAFVFEENSSEEISLVFLKTTTRETREIIGTSSFSKSVFQNVFAHTKTPSFSNEFLRRFGDRFRKALGFVTVSMPIAGVKPCFQISLTLRGRCLSEMKKMKGWCAALLSYFSCAIIRTAHQVTERLLSNFILF